MVAEEERTWPRLGRGSVEDAIAVYVECTLDDGRGSMRERGGVGRGGNQPGLRLSMAVGHTRGIPFPRQILSSSQAQTDDDQHYGKSSSVAAWTHSRQARWSRPDEVMAELGYS